MANKKLPLIPMDAILPEFRKMAVVWGKYFNFTSTYDIREKHKLASDFQNVALIEFNKTNLENKKRKNCTEKRSVFQLTENVLISDRIAPTSLTMIDVLLIPKKVSYLWFESTDFGENKSNVKAALLPCLKPDCIIATY